MCEASIFRIDPPPFSENSDPMKPPPKLVRFTFQRFQDHLMAKALTMQVKSRYKKNTEGVLSTLLIEIPRIWGMFSCFRMRSLRARKYCYTEAFSSDGPLSFLLKDSQFGKVLNSQFAGLVGALSITFPEELGVEFAMTLPDWEHVWKNGRIVQEGFSESLKWRKVDTFSEDTRVLLNNLDEYHMDIFGLLLEVSMTVDHPYNALFLHNRLKQWSLPKRDSVWTYWINQASRREQPQIERIISWALGLSDQSADIKHLQLASVILTWFLSSSHLTLRDRATKALTAVFLANSNVYEFIAPLIYGCDDPYVIERLYAGAFGACCLDPDADRLSSYSRVTYDLFFAGGKPPIGLLARDYALGIIELAEAKGALSSEVCLSNCYHPFSSTPPTFGLNFDEVEIIAKKSGDKSIFNSASGEWGDFGKYSIPGRVSSFLTTPLSEPKPLSKDEIKKQFYANVIEPFPDRVEALKNFKNYASISIRKSELVSVIKEEYPDKNAEQLASSYIAGQERCRTNLEQLLSVEEQTRLSNEYLREGKGHKNYNSVSVSQCRLWVTKRAYELGWKVELFPNDRGIVNSGYRNDLERIGKKYQRIALDELQARLADNFWYLPDWPEVPTRYRYSHHDYRRNVEPTILSPKSRYGKSDENNADWITQPHVKLPDIPEENLIQWPFQEDPTESFTSKLRRPDNAGREWLLLYEYSSDRQKYSEPSTNGHGIRLDEFRFIYCVFLQKGKSTGFVEYLNQKRDLNVDSFEPVGFTSSPYLLEAFWRDTWQSEKFGNHRWAAPEGYEFAIPVASYQWESHLDKTLPNGFSRNLPQKWFADELRLKMADSRSNSWANSNNHNVLLSICESENRSVVVIDQETLFNYLKQFEVEPVWIMIAERNTWPSSNVCVYRRSEAVAWKDEDNWRHYSWNHDYSPLSK